MYDKNKIITDIFYDVKKRCKDLMQKPKEAIPFASWLVDQLLKAKKDSINFMEIGVAQAGNFTFIGNVLKSFFNEVHGVGVDKAKCLSSIKRMKPKFKWKFICGNSQHAGTIKAIKQFTNYVDILYIDGGHRATECENDLNNYVHLVENKPFVVAIHDYQVLRYDKKYKSILLMETLYSHKEWIASTMGIGAFIIK